MFLSRSINSEINEEKIDNILLAWNRSSEKVLNVVTVPYNFSTIFINLILSYVRDEKKVIYITNEYVGNIDLIKQIKKSTSFRNYSYLKKDSTNSQSKLKICNFERALELEEKFDLIIYDDIRSFPCYRKFEIVDLMVKLAHSKSKFIAYSSEVIFIGKKELIMPIKYSKIPMVEPRSVITRIDINKDIPFVIYDYLKWSTYSGRKVIICVPDEEKVKNVSRYIKEYCKRLDVTLIVSSKAVYDKKNIDNFEKIKKSVLITDDFKRTFMKERDADVMVYFADDYKFDYKKIIYFCGSVGRGVKGIKGEVILLANEESEQMEIAKSIARNFNKEAWEMGLLNI